jgi:hypothetical protein
VGIGAIRSLPLDDRPGEAVKHKHYGFDGAIAQKGDAER